MDDPYFYLSLLVMVSERVNCNFVLLTFVNNPMLFIYTP